MLRRTAQKLFNITTIGPVHPDVMWGHMQGTYRGPGWVGWQKVLPMEAMMMQGGSTLTSVSDRVGYIIDPEDPRHPIATVTNGANSNPDGSIKKMVEGNDLGAPPMSSRLLQVLYDSYLEPFSMHRVCTILDDGAKAPNHHHFDLGIDHVGQTSSIIGGVIAGYGCTFGEGCTLKADVNSIYLQEGVQVMDNVCMVTDRPTQLHHYQRDEELNPYQTFNPMEGTVVVKLHTIIENNVFLDACQIGKFNRIGHGSRIMKGVTSGDFVHVLPGSVVTANTKMNDGELWGGAPARKLGKVSKFYFKRVFAAANLVRDFVNFIHGSMTKNGDQTVHRMYVNEKLNKLFEPNCSTKLLPSIKAKIKYFSEGREPWNHKITRLTQGWQPSNRADDRTFMFSPPMSVVHNYAYHNCDSYDSKWIGSRMNVTQYHTEFMW